MFAWLFAPAAFLMGSSRRSPACREPARQKLSVNEHYAYCHEGWEGDAGFMSDRSYMLTAFALTGFAISAVGIPLAASVDGPRTPRRPRACRLKALFVGFVATLLNGPSRVCVTDAIGKARASPPPAKFVLHGCRRIARRSSDRARQRTQGVRAEAAAGGRKCRSSRLPPLARAEVQATARRLVLGKSSASRSRA